MSGMASISERTRADGTIAYDVAYRFGGRGSRKGSLAFDDLKSAEAFDAAVVAHGAAKALEMHGIDPTPATKAKALTVADWLTTHIDSLHNLDAYTPHKYRQYRAEIVEFWGEDKTLTSVTPADVADWVAWLQENGGRGGDGNAPKTISNKHGYLAGAMRAAVRAGKLAANPCEGTRLPRKSGDTDHDMRMLTKDEFRSLLAATDERWRLMVEFLVASGMRWGEAAALQPRHVDVKAGTVIVRQAWKYSPDTGYRLGPPKTKRSRRTVDLPPRLLARLDLAGEYVFCNADGGPVRYPRFWRDVWNPAVEAAGLEPRPTPHDLRHTFASWQLTGGTPILVVSRQLGHESIAITADIYADVDRASAKQAAVLMDSMLD